MKDIIINGRFLSRRLTGVDRFAIEILKVLDRWIHDEDAALSGLRFRIATPRVATPSVQFSNLPTTQVGTLSGQLWEQWDLPQAAGGRSVVLNLCNTAPVRTRNQVVTIHDATTAALPEAFSRGFRLWYRVLMPLLGHRSHSVLTVSEFSRAEIARLFGIPRSKMQVVSEGGEHILRVEPDPSALSRFDLQRRPYVLAVSSMAAHKNFKLVLDALARIPDAPFDVAIAGGANARVFGTAGIAADPRVKWLGYVSDAELRALYEGAMAFVFPSLYEGFGIPPLEAMHCGSPVLASNAASMPEVCGDAALYFDPRSADELAGALQRVASDAALRHTLKAKGYERARQFSWEIGARQVLAACRPVAEAP